jgi:hypothetical protein
VCQTIFEDEPGRRSAAKLLGNDEARRIAVNMPSCRIREIEGTGLKMAERYGRGLCCHEAGHAVVLWSFRVQVFAVRVTFSDEKGWHGAPDIPKGSADQLPYTDRVTILSAGKAEEFFDCPAYERAWLHDFGEIALLLNCDGMPPDELWPRIDEGKALARIILAEHRKRALKLVGHLFQYGRVSRAEFSSLMMGDV